MDVPTDGMQQVGHVPESPESGVLSWAVPQPLGSSDLDWEGLGSCHSSQRASSSGRVKKAGSMTSLPVRYGASESPKTQRVASLELWWLTVCALSLG